MLYSYPVIDLCHGNQNVICIYILNMKYTDLHISYTVFLQTCSAINIVSDHNIILC